MLCTNKRYNSDLLSKDKVGQSLACRSYGKHHEFVVLVGLHEVVHEVRVEQRLDHTRDEGSPDHVFPTENPELTLTYQCKI